MTFRLLDLFCGAGGAAMGYNRAGFKVTGVDIRPQPGYPFSFMLADVLDLDLSETNFDAIHASPPCEHYSKATFWRGQPSDHPDLVEQKRDLLVRSGLPWVIENVVQAPLRPDLVLCATMFGLPAQRHRAFECSWPVSAPLSCNHGNGDHIFDHGSSRTTEGEFRAAIECDWMTTREARDAIPPSYTEFIGKQLSAHLRSAIVTP